MVLQVEVTFESSSGNTSLPSSHFAELLREIVHGIQSVHKVIVSQFLPSSESEALRGPGSILDLPPVDIPLREHTKLRLGDIRSRVHLGDEGLPDLILGFDGELVEVQSDVDTRKEGFIEDFDAIGREEHNAAVIFNVTKAATEEDELKNTL